MYLEEIEIIGFKSFANKTVLKFPAPSETHKGITAIVGPNGSGKSNVADAIRWVLGESSSKTLRGKSRDDVIFSGSARKNRMNFAEVTLRINNTENTAGIDLSEIEITRRVFRNGEAEFLLNKNKVRKEDILLLLAKASFGQRTYAVIGQGMADSVLSASLQERKAFFEEAAGVTQYQIKRQQTINKFEATRENLAQTELTIQELEPRLKSLTRQIKKLEQREILEKELSLLQKQYYNHLLGNLATHINETTTQKNEIDAKITKLQKEINAIQEKMNAAYTGDSRQSIFEQLQKEYNSLIQEKNTLLRDEALIKAKKDAEYQKAGQSNIVWLNNKRDELAQEARDIQDTIARLLQNITLQAETIQQYQKELEHLEKRIVTVKKELEVVRQSVSSEFDEEDDLKEIYDLQGKLLEDLMNAKDLSVLEDIRNQARAINAKMAVYIETLHAKKKTQSMDMTTLQAQLEQLIEQKNILTGKVADSKITLQSHESQKSLFESQVQEKQQEQVKIQNELALASSEKQESNLVVEIEKQLADITLTFTGLESRIKEVEAKIQTFNEAEEEKKAELIALQRENQDKQGEFNRLSQQVNTLNIELAKHSIRVEDIEKEILETELEIQAVRALSHDQTLTAQKISEEEAHAQIHQLKKQLEIIGGIDEETVREYTEIKERYEFLTSQTQDLENAIISMEKIIEELDQTIKKQFDEAFKEINKEFQKYFKILFNGGRAELTKVTLEEEKKKLKEEEGQTEVVEEGVSATVSKITKRIKEREKEQYSGIEIIAEPPGKKISSINMLSGGERALTSIALISAIISNNNSPFVLLDEMDAALDESNALRFASILKELSHETQFIVITHTRATMSEAQLLYGVTMGDDGVSQLLSIELKDAEQLDVVRH